MATHYKRKSNKIPLNFVRSRSRKLTVRKEVIIVDDRSAGSSTNRERDTDPGLNVACFGDNDWSAEDPTTHTQRSSVRSGKH